MAHSSVTAGLIRRERKLFWSVLDLETSAEHGQRVQTNPNVGAVLARSLQEVVWLQDQRRSPRPALDAEARSAQRRRLVESLPNIKELDQILPGFKAALLAGSQDTEQPAAAQAPVLVSFPAKWS